MRIRSQTSFVAAMMLLLGIVMIGIPAGLLHAFAADGPVPTGVWVLAVPFGGLGLLFAWLSTKRLVSRWRVGPWELECPDSGVAFGQPHSVQLMPPRVMTPTVPLECRLTCLGSRPRTGARSTSGGVHQSSQSNTRTLFDTSWTFPASTLHPQSGVSMPVPLPPFGLGSRRGRAGAIEWKLSVIVTADGSAHEMEFEIPVAADRLEPA